MKETDANAAPRPRRSGALVTLDLLLFGALLILPLTWFFGELDLRYLHVSWGWKPVVAPLLLLIVRILFKRRHGGATGWMEALLYRKLAFAWLTPFVLLAGIELVLALCGVKKMAAVPIVIRGEEDVDTKLKEGDSKVIMDPELLWRFAPNVSWGTIRINEHGYRTRPFTIAKAPGTRRVIALGDSCTAQGDPPYSDRLHQMLQKKPPTGEPWEAFNMGVFGYSIEQGYRQFIREDRDLQPDVVTIYFGWNDHWLHEKPDRLRLATRMSPARARLARAMQDKRLVGLLVSKLKQQPQPATESRRKGFRVPPEQYAETLSNLVVAIRGAGAVPVVITAPRRELTPTLVKSGHAEDEHVAETAHDQYVELTRAIAQQMNAPLLDLARLFSGPECDKYFSRDGIHFEPDGLHAIARALHGKLRELADTGQLPPAR